MEQQKKLWNEIPSYVFVSLARRGMEKISLDQCFLPNCGNKDSKLLEPLKKEEFQEKNKQIKIIHMKCHKCQGKYQIKLETIEKVAKPSRTSSIREEVDANILSMGLVYVLDENGKNLGHIGYF